MFNCLYTLLDLPVLFFRPLKIKMNRKSKCKVYDKEFNYVTELLSHLKVHLLPESNSVSSKTKSKHKCELCCKYFGLYILKDHVNSFHLKLFMITVQFIT